MIFKILSFTMITQIMESDKQNGLVVGKKLNKLPKDSKVKFFRKENCKYHVQLFDNANDVKELYELKVKLFFLFEIFLIIKFKLNVNLHKILSNIYFKIISFN